MTVISSKLAVIKLANYLFILSERLVRLMTVLGRSLAHPVMSKEVVTVEIANLWRKKENE